MKIYFQTCTWKQYRAIPVITTQPETKLGLLMNRPQESFKLEQKAKIDTSKEINR